jgi:hypothetical protein
LKLFYCDGKQRQAVRDGTVYEGMGVEGIDLKAFGGFLSRVADKLTEFTELQAIAIAKELWLNRAGQGCD